MAICFVTARDQGALYIFDTFLGLLDHRIFLGDVEDTPWYLKYTRCGKCLVVASSSRAVTVWRVEKQGVAFAPVCLLRVHVHGLGWGRDREDRLLVDSIVDVLSEGEDVQCIRDTAGLGIVRVDGHFVFSETDLLVLE